MDFHFAIREGEMSDRFESDENAKPAGDHVEIGGTTVPVVGARIEGDVLWMFDRETVTVLEVDDERAKRSLSQKTLYFGPNSHSSHRLVSI